MNKLFEKHETLFCILLNVTKSRGGKYGKIHSFVKRN